MEQSGYLKPKRVDLMIEYSQDLEIDIRPVLYFISCLRSESVGKYSHN